VEERIRFGHRVLGAEWSSEDARWTVRAEYEGEPVELTCDFLHSCTGYYRYDEGHSPEFPGSERFEGEIVHPQRWPEGFDPAGKRIVVIGSGATAVTLVPALAERAAEVTMLQRSPSFILSLPESDRIAMALRRRLPERTAYAATRWKNMLLTVLSYQVARRAPRLSRRLLRRGVARELPTGYPVGRDFDPTYEPWDQRLCLVPGGDLFRAIRGGGASVVTGRIETFTESGIRLASGRGLEADAIVTATGLELLLFGGIELSIDGEQVDPARRVAYKGTMLSGVPNFAFALGYVNASFTLKTDLVAEYVCRLLRHMDARGHRVATPRAPDPSVPEEPLIDLSSGYVVRSVDLLPRQTAVQPWRANQNYFVDRRQLGRGPVDDEIEFAAGSRAAA